MAARMFAPARTSAMRLARPQLIRRAMSSGAEYEPRMAQTSWGKTILNTPLLGQAVKLFADGYAGIVASELKKYGLRHQDVLVVTKDVVETLDRMPKAELDMRNKRLKRAADLSLKHTYLPYDLQEAHDPWADYMTEPLANVVEERLEKQAIGKGRPSMLPSPIPFSR